MNLQLTDQFIKYICDNKYYVLIELLYFIPEQTEQIQKHSLKIVKSMI